jgi:hypothetical protein
MAGISLLQRLLNALPTNWVPNATEDENGRPYRAASQLAGTAAVYQAIQNQINYLIAQTRIQTSTGGFLDMSSRGYFGTKWPRQAGESDQSYATRLLSKFFLPQGTYQAMIDALENLTGETPKIVRPRRPYDTGAYGEASTMAFPTSYLPGNGGMQIASTPPGAPPVTGSPIYVHTAVTSGDSNVGYKFTSANAQVGETVTATVYIYVPNTYVGAEILFDIENTQGIATVGANMALTNQWQQLTVSETVTAAENMNFVLRGSSTEAGQQFYSSGWGYTQSESGPLPVSQSVRRGYSCCGAYGSLLMPYQAGVSVKQPNAGSIPNRGGYGSLTGMTATQNWGGGGYATLVGKTASQNFGWQAYSSLDEMTGGVSAADIYKTVLETKQEGTLVWVQITD